MSRARIRIAITDGAGLVLVESTDEPIEMDLRSPCVPGECERMSWARDLSDDEVERVRTYAEKRYGVPMRTGPLLFLAASG